MPAPLPPRAHDRPATAPTPTDAESLGYPAATRLHRKPPAKAAAPRFHCVHPRRCARSAQRPASTAAPGLATRHHSRLDRWRHASAAPKPPDAPPQPSAPQPHPADCDHRPAAARSAPTARHAPLALRSRPARASETAVARPASARQLGPAACAVASPATETKPKAAACQSAPSGSVRQAARKNRPELPSRQPASWILGEREAARFLTFATPVYHRVQKDPGQTIRSAWRLRRRPQTRDQWRRRHRPPEDAPAPGAESAAARTAR